MNKAKPVIFSHSIFFLEQQQPQQNDNLQNLYMRGEKLIFHLILTYFSYSKKKIKHKREVNQRKVRLQWQL